MITLESVAAPDATAPNGGAGFQGPLLVADDGLSAVADKALEPLNAPHDYRISLSYLNGSNPATIVAETAIAQQAAHSIGLAPALAHTLFGEIDRPMFGDGGRRPVACEHHLGAFVADAPGQGGKGMDIGLDPVIQQQVAVLLEIRV